MKTSKELTDKWFETKTTMPLEEFVYTEHDKEIISLIDEIIKENWLYSNHCVESALTELKNRLAYCKQVGE